MSLDVTVQYFDGCPSWEVAVDRVIEAAERTGLDVTVKLEKVTSLDEAERLRFPGSPTILAHGGDLFADPNLAPGLSCRLYRSAEGLSGSPSVAQLEDAVAHAAKDASHG